MRVEREMAALGYIPNAAARSLITRRTQMLGLVVSNITNGFYPEIIDAITSCALEHGYTVLVGSAGERPESQAAYLRLMAEQRVDGVILTSTLFGDASDLAALVRTGLPIVLANRVRAGLPVDGVSLDNIAAGEVATNHLIEHGRSAIAYVGGQAETATDQGRRAGYERALRAARLPPFAVPYVPGAFTREHGYDATRRLLEARRLPDGIVAADDTIALGCLDALAEAGADVPGQVSVVGFDDIPAASLRPVWLTTVSTAAREMGTRAVELLLERLRGRSEPPRRDVLPAEIVIRGTCGPHEAPHPSPRQTSLSSRRPARQHARVPALIGGPS